MKIHPTQPILHRTEVVKYLFSSSMGALVTASILAILLVLVLWGTNSPSLMVSWLVLVELTYLARIALLRAYRRVASVDSTLWLNRFRLGVAISGVMWGGAVLLLFPSHDVVGQFALSFTIAGLAAGGVTSYAIDSPSLFSFLVPLGLPLIVRLSAEGTPQSMTMSIMVVLFLGYVSISLRRSYGAMHENIRLHIDAVKREETIREQKEFLNTILESEPECVKVVALDGKLLQINRAGLSMLGVDSLDAAQQLGLLEFILPEYRNAFIALHKSVCAGNSGQLEFQIKGNNNILRWLDMHATPLRDANGQVSALVSVTRDITDAKHQQQALKIMAHYDALTQLPNRILFADRFSQAIARAKRDGSLLAVCYLDLDGFKQVNDTFGHETGDRLLIEVAERIKFTLREEDTVSRFGGDEFAFLLSSLQTVEQYKQTLERIHQTIAQPYFLDGQSVSIAASTGVTLYPLDDADADALLRHADQAMYQAKQQGRNRFYLFDAAQDQQLQSQHQQVSIIAEAFSRNEFRLYYQPKVDMSSGKIIGTEALIRWIHPERGILCPAEFLPTIEGTPLEFSVGNWVIEEALKQLEIWRQIGLELQVSVNISPGHLLEKEFFAHLDKALSRHPDIPSHKLQLEVLESSVLDELVVVTNILHACRDALGVSIALDDFGTGYSSLTHLRHLPTDTIKIDQTFVRDMIDDPNDFAIVEGVIGLAGAFRRDVIAEGVEIEEWVRDYRPDAKWLHYARHPLTPIEARLMQSIIENHHWGRRMEECLDAPEGAALRWPIMNHEKCHFGRWVRHARKENLFGSSLLAEIDGAHVELHRIGNTLMRMHLDGKIKEARSGIKELKELVSKLDAMLHQLD
jgi:diguanylate cyclase (GGDEF)-like protein/PAS domain S-box-containing protein